DLLIEKDRRPVVDFGPRDMEFGALVMRPTVINPHRTPVFGDADVEIFKITAVEHYRLRVDFGVADAFGKVETEIAAGHDFLSDRGRDRRDRGAGRKTCDRVDQKRDVALAGETVIASLDQRDLDVIARQRRRQAKADLGRNVTVRLSMEQAHRTAKRNFSAQKTV